jgi:Rieske Fe-S protein
MERKTFIRTLALGTVAVCAGACSPSKSLSDSKSAIEIDLDNPAFQALKTKDGYVIEQNLLIVNTGAELPLVLSGLCPHAFKKVMWDASSNSVKCPAHGSRFDATGIVTKGPARENLAQYRVEKKDNRLKIYQL